MSEVRRIVGWGLWTCARTLVHLSARVLATAPLGLVADDLAASMGRVPRSSTEPLEVA
jgi:hypothetical protein